MKALWTAMGILGHSQMRLQHWGEETACDTQHYDEGDGAGELWSLQVAGGWGQIKSRHNITISFHSSSVYLLSDEVRATEGIEVTKCEDVGRILGLVAHLHAGVVNDATSGTQLVGLLFENPGTFNQVQPTCTIVQYTSRVQQVIIEYIE